MNAAESKNLMTRSDLIALHKLSTAKDLVSLKEIPSSFVSDFDKYFLGRTLVKDDDGVLFAYPHDIRQWVKYLFIIYND